MREWCAATVMAMATWSAPAGAQDVPEPSAPEARARAEPRVTEAQLAGALARASRGEPPIGVVVREALRVQSADPDGVGDLVTRARVSGLVPIVRGGVRRGRGQDLSELQAGDDGRATWSTGDDLSVYGTLTFRLDRLVFAGEEVPLLREERSRRAERWDLVRDVVRVYYERRRLMVERALFGPDLARELRIAELGALLDGFTDGAFSRMIRGSP